VPFYKTAMQCVTETKEIFINGYHQDKQIAYKGAVDLVTTIDKSVEEKVIDIIHDKYPDHDILAEESDEVKRASAYRWIIDPLDGTTNFAHSHPHFALSIALEKNDSLILGIVYNPISEELFYAEKGKGAYLNNKKISVSAISSLSQALLATGFPYDRHTNADLYVSELKKMMVVSQGIRRAGVASLDLCYLACGRFDGFWERKLKPWDVAASILIIEEAGGKITTFSGNQFSFSEKTILGSNQLIHQKMVSTLAH